eukprot:scaffold47750_cov54-Attheya_sp.AAC.2
MEAVTSGGDVPAVSRGETRVRFEATTKSDKPEERKQGTPQKKTTMCKFCGISPAGIFVETNNIITGLGSDQSKSSSQQRRRKRPLCLEHYYTTRAVRKSPLVVFDASIVEEQLDDIQELYAQAWMDLQQDIAQESARTYQATRSDPLSILHNIGGIQKKAKRPQSSIHQIQTSSSEGGFIRNIPLPQRFAQTQETQQKQLMIQQNSPTAKERQQKQHASHMARMNETQSNPYKRRKPTRTSYWNLALDQKGPVVPQDETPENIMTATCSCGSNNVINEGNITGRNNDMAKAETWGNKDRCEVVSRYRCEKCGKTWNEEE